MIALEVVNGGRMPAGHLIQVQSDRTIFGRHSNCHVVLESAGVSRYQAQILEANCGYFIENLCDCTATHVNGEQIQGRRQLQDKDLIRICDFTFRFLRSAHDNRPPNPQTSRVDVSE